MVNSDSIRWNIDNTISLSTVPKTFKKITGTKFAAILGKNPYCTDFEIWCDLTRVYSKSIEPTIYTNAGILIEPRQADYCKNNLGMSNLITPSQIYGENYFKNLKGNFFSDPIFGGMWDYLLVDRSANPLTVLEMKTTKNVDSWKDDIPEYYALQAALYAYLLKVDEVLMVVSFLLRDDYKILELYTPTIKNTRIIPFKLSERYPQFKEQYIDRVIEWYYTYVVSLSSPMYDLDKDKFILEGIIQKYGN